MKPQTVKLPAFLASALVNGDRSSLTTDDDLAMLHAALKYVAPGRVVSAEGEPYIGRFCDLPGCAGDQHDVLDYLVMYPERYEVCPDCEASFKLAAGEQFPEHDFNSKRCEMSGQLRPQS